MFDVESEDEELKMTPDMAAAAKSSEKQFRKKGK